jgi:hypothetical protein
MERAHGGIEAACDYCPLDPASEDVVSQIQG